MNFYILFIELSGIPFSICIITFGLYYFNGVFPVVCILSLSIFFIVIICFCIKKEADLKGKMREYTDNRLFLVGEVIDGMQTIKLNVWENRFNEIINKVRNKETKGLFYSFLFRVVYLTFSFCSSKIVLLSSLLLLIIIVDYQFTVISLFMIIVLLTTMEYRLFTQFPRISLALGDCCNSIKRIQVQKHFYLPSFIY